MRIRLRAGRRGHVHSGGAPDARGVADPRVRGMERLPVSGGPTCTLTIDGDGQSLVALFDPQIVGARFAGSTLDSADRERAAVSAAMRDRRSAGRASGVSGRAPPLHARRPEAAAGGEWNPGLCDIPVSTSRCEVVAGHLRWTSLRFGTADFPQDIPPAVVVRFGVRKSGGGSGTVRGEGVDCGDRCSGGPRLRSTAVAGRRSRSRVRASPAGKAHAAAGRPARSMSARSPRSRRPSTDLRRASRERSRALGSGAPRARCYLAAARPASWCAGTAGGAWC